MQTITGATLLTPAQAVAVTQVLGSGNQGLLINAFGAAAGGSAIVNSQQISNLMIPQGVNVTGELGSLGSLNIAGNLSNAGSLLLAGNSALLSVNATSILNLQGALISTLQPGASLALNALQNINNAGTISSLQNVYMNAGGSIANSGLVQAGNSVNLASMVGNYVNSGTVVAQTGNINFASATTGTTTSLDNTGGSLQAMLGSINFGDALNLTKDLSITGGDMLSQALNLNGSHVGADLGNVTGTVNVNACEAYFNSTGETLSLGVWNVTGDPLITNTGNIDISQTAALSGTLYVILAGGNITSNASSFLINTSVTNPAASSKGGGNVMLGAGVNFKSNQILGASASGGDIKLGNLNGTVIDTHSVKPNTPGGNVTLFAYPNAVDPTVGGHVALGGNILTTGNGTGNNGSVIVVAGATSSILDGASTVSLNDITTGSGGAAGSGSVTISTSIPNTAAGVITLDSATGNVKSGTFLGGAPVQGSVVAGTIVTDGAPVTISAGSDAPTAIAISISSINTSSTNGNGGAVTISANGVSDSSIIISGDITTLSNKTAGVGGSVLVSTLGSLSLQSIVTGNTVSNTKSSAGNILLNTGGDGNDITFNYLWASGQSGGSIQAIASGDIISSGASVPAGLGASPENVNSTGVTGNSGNITLIAGADNSFSGTTTTVNGATASGGNLSLSVASGVNSSVGSTNSAGNAGDVTLLSFNAVPNTGLISINGHVFAKGGVPSTATGTSGDVLIMGGAKSTAAGTTITLPDISTINTTQAGGGDVTIKTAQAAGGVSIVNGVVGGDFNSGAVDTSGVVTVGNISTTGANIVTTSTVGGNVYISAGENGSAGTDAITVNGSINTVASNDGPASSVGQSNTGGSVTLITGITGSGTQTKQDITVTGNITTTGAFNLAIGGPVELRAGTNLNLGTSTITTGNAAAIAGGGPVLLSAGNSGSNSNVTFKNIVTTGIYGGSVQMFATGNISSTTAGLQVDTHGKNIGNTGNGGNILMAAGASVLTDETTTSILGPSGFGGNVTLTNGGGQVIDTTYQGTNGSGGSVTMLAFANAAKTTNGRISVSGDIDTFTNITGVIFTDLQDHDFALAKIGGSGNVVAIAEGPSTAQSTIVLNNVNTTGTVNGTGNITLVTASPNTTDPIVTNNNSGVVVSGSLLGGTYRAGAVSAKNLFTNGGNVQIYAGQNNSGPSNAISITGDIDTSAISGIGGDGGAVTLMTGLTGATTNTNINVTGDIITSGNTLAEGDSETPRPDPAFGGTVSLMSTANITVNNITTGDSTSASDGSGANGGVVILLAGSKATGNGNITFNDIETLGGSTNTTTNNLGSGGNVMLVSMAPTSGNISGNSITTSANTISGNGTSGSVAISTAVGTIDVDVDTSSLSPSTSTRSGDVVLSTGKTSGNPVINVAVDATNASGNNSGSVYAFFNNTIKTTFTGDTNDNNTITNVPNTSQLAVGMTVTGTGVAVGTFITQISGSSVTLNQVTSGGAMPGITFNSGSPDSVIVTLASSNSLTPSLNAGPVGALTVGGTPNLNFSGGTPSKVDQTPGPVIPTFFSPGGFTSINSATSIQFSGNDNLLIPIVSLDPVNGVNMSNSSTNSSAPTLAFFGTSVTLNGTINRFQKPIIAASSGNISIVSNNTANSDLNIGTIITPGSFSASIPSNIFLGGTIVAKSVSLDAVGGGTPGVSDGGFIRYSSSSINPIRQLITNDVSLQANREAGKIDSDPARPIYVNGSGDAIQFHDSLAASISLVANGNVYLRDIATTKFVLNSGSPSLNNNANIFVGSLASAQNQGSLTVSGAIDAPYGNLFLLGAASITTDGPATITANQRDGEIGNQTGGNNAFLIAGTTAYLQNGNIVFQGRSGVGGDIIMPGLTNALDLNVSTDKQQNGGNLAIVAYSNTIAGLLGGVIDLPSSLTVGIYNPLGTNTTNSGSYGITIVGEASGGPTAETVISIGQAYGATGSINIKAGTPTGLTTTPVIISQNGGQFGGPTNLRFFEGQIQTNSSIVTGQLSVLGTASGQQTNPANIGRSQQGISVSSGGSLDTGNIITLGAAGGTPQANNVPGPPFLPQNTSGFDGGSAGAVFMIANSNLTINGDLYAFGGGGGGGMGAAFGAIGSVSAGVPGGNGGSGGDGGYVTVQASGTISITGDINTSGGGGGGGGGGYGGVTNQSGGTGGGGGDAGDIQILAGKTSGSTINVGGTIIAVGGGAGGNGGLGMVGVAAGPVPPPTFGGSGGGGGGSFGSGGGGGGAGVLAPFGIGSGLGGAGGGGLFGGGGGDTFNTVTSPTSQVQSGFGGWGAGGTLPNVGVPSQAGGIFGAGFKGGVQNAGFGTPVIVPTGEDGVGNVGGTGGTYYSDTGRLVPPLGNPINLLPAAVGGTLGNGGSGGATALSAVPTAAGQPGADAGRGPSPTNGFGSARRDGVLTMTGFGFTTPSLIRTGVIFLKTNAISTATAAGDLNITGNLIASGNFNGTSPVSNCTNCVFGAQVASTTGGSINIAPSTTINTYLGNILIENDNGSGFINIGANSQIFARNSGQQFPLNISMGQPSWLPAPTINPVQGKTPANVTTVVKTLNNPPNSLSFGQAGITAVGPTNTIYALGNQTFLVNFQSGFNGTTTVGNTKSINLGGGVQLGASSRPGLTSLDLSNASVISDIQNLQNNQVIGGTITTSSGILTGGSISLFPINIAGDLSAFNIIQPSAALTVTMTNFTTLNPINVRISDISTVNNVVINSPLVFTGSTQPVNFNVSSNQGSVFGININATTGAPTTGKGAVTTSGSLNFNVEGAITVNGAMTASASSLGLNSTATDQSINVTANITAKTGLTASTLGTGDFIMTTGTLATGGITMNVDSFQLGVNSTTKALVNNTGTFTIFGTGSVTTNAGSTVSSTTGLNWSMDGPISVGANVTSSGGTAIMSSDVDINLGAAVSGSKGVTIAAGTNLNSTGVITASAGQVSLSSLTGTTTVSANVTGKTGVSISSSGLFAQTAGTISATNSSISLIAPSPLNLLKLAAGTGTVALAPFDGSQAISVGTASAAYNVLPSDLAKITAGTVQIGSTSGTAPIDVNATIDATGKGLPKTGPYSLSFIGNPGSLSATFSSNGQLMALGTKNLTINVGGAVNLGQVQGGTIVNITGTSVVLNSGFNIATAGTLSIATNGNTAGGSINAGNFLTTVPATLSLKAVGSTSSIIGFNAAAIPSNVTNLTLGSGTGGFGSIAVTSNAKTVSLFSPLALTLSSGAATLSLPQVIVDDLTVTSSVKSTITTGAMSGNNLTLNMNLAGGGFVINGNMNYTGTVALNGQATGTIVTGKTPGTITAPTVSMISGKGSIGASKTPILLAASNLTASTDGSVFVTDSAKVAIIGSNKGATFSVIGTSPGAAPPALNLVGTLTGSTIILSTTNPTGSMQLNNTITTTGSSTAVTLSSAGPLTQVSGTVTAKTLTLSAGSSGISMGVSANSAAVLTAKSTGPVSIRNVSQNVSLGASSGGAAFNLTHDPTTAGTLTVTGAVTARSINLSSNNGNIDIKGSVAGVGGSSAITLNATGNLTGSGVKVLGNGALGGNIGGAIGTKSAGLGTAVSGLAFTAGTGINIVNTGALNTSGAVGSLVSAAGNIVLKTSGKTDESIGSVGNAFTTTTPSSSTGSLILVAAGTGSVNVANTTVGTLLLDKSSAGRQFNLSTSDSLTLNGVTTAAPQTSTAGEGSISLIANGATLAVNGNVKSVGGAINIQNTNTVNGTITVKGGAQITTLISVTVPTSAAQIGIGVYPLGPISKTNPGTLTLPQFKTTPSGGASIFGGSVPANVTSPAGATSITAKGADVIFEAPAGTSITFQGAATVKADPPVPSIGPALLSKPTAMPVRVQAAPAPLTSPVSMMAPSVGTQTTPSTSNIMNATPVQPSNNAAHDAGFNAENFILFDGSNLRSRSTEVMIDSKQHVAREEFRPAALHQTVESTPVKQATHGIAPTASAMSSMGVDAHVSGENKVTLRKGSVMLVPQHDTVVETAFGSIKLAADSVVLVVAKNDSVSVYNFHDTHAGSVVASVNGQEVKLAPGHHMTMTGAFAAFDQLNPLPVITHRSMKLDHGTAVKVYSSEFSILSALSGMKTWTELKQSGDKRDAHLVQTVLKDAAIIMQVRKGSGGYREYRAPSDKLASAELH